MEVEGWEVGEIQNWLCDVGGWERLKPLVEGLVQRRDVEGLERVAAIVERGAHADSLLRHLIAAAIQLQHKPLLQALLQAIKRTGLDELKMETRECFADCLEKEGRYSEAASCLGAGSLALCQEPISRQVLAYARTAELHLKAFETTLAESVCNRIAPLLQEVSDEKILCRCKAVRARLLEHKLRHLDAAVLYAELSNSQDRPSSIRAFEAACLCLVWCAASSPAKFKHLMEQHVQPSKQGLGSPIGGVLHKMYTQKLIGKSDVAILYATLQEYQRRLAGANMELLKTAVAKYNMVAASSIFETVTMESLAACTDTTPEQAEKLTSELIRQGVLDAKIDQPGGIILFGNTSSSVDAWSSEIGRVCALIERTATAVSSLSPHAQSICNSSETGSVAL